MPASPDFPALFSGSESQGMSLSLLGDGVRGNDLFVVGVGASAGGLEACRKLLEAFPRLTRTAVIFVQHLAPTHESLLVGLLATHTAMTVVQAENGMSLQPDYLYIIPPGTCLEVTNGVLRSFTPELSHVVRLPFDVLLHSLAVHYGARAACVVLSGTGTDGSDGLTAIKRHGGLTIVQKPDEAGCEGMPLSAIAPRDADYILPVSDIPNALAARLRTLAAGSPPAETSRVESSPEWLPAVVELLRSKTRHDFTLYKRGALERRIQRRCTMAVPETESMADYIEILRTDPEELQHLANDILIDVRPFFRHIGVFESLAKTVIPDIVRQHAPAGDIRIWIAGCSTGEETYSLLMLFREEILASGHRINLQFFASDVDPGAIAQAREGLYPETISADISPERLVRFFTREGRHYRVLPEFRSMVLFATHDVLEYPPFSRLDMISCRNLLIYLKQEARARLISIFHFSLRENGTLLLGRAETVGKNDGRFKMVSKFDRIYRRSGRGTQRDLDASLNSNDSVARVARQERAHSDDRDSAMAELCRRLVLQRYAPAAVLIDLDHQCLFSVGPTDQYLHVVSGAPTQDLLAMSPSGVGNKLRLAIQRVRLTESEVVISDCKVEQRGTERSFRMEVQPVLEGGEERFLVCFIDEPVRIHHPQAVDSKDMSHVALLEQELELVRADLASAIRSLEIVSEDHKAASEEALSVNEEYRSTNEALLNSKAELQSLNEEQTELNARLKETLERQRITSNDLRNVLCSTEVAAVFLDPGLDIRLFTPATGSLFNVRPGDIGRPLGDLSALVPDDRLLDDARAVLKGSVVAEREIQARSGSWFVRRVLPYYTGQHQVEGVVVTFTDITERKLVKNALAEAKLHADRANAAKSRFLAATSHDLKQPIQALILLQGSLADTVESDAALKLVERMDHILGSMSSMLSALLDINQIEAGTVHADVSEFPIDDILRKMKNEFTDSSFPLNVCFRVAPCRVAVRSDPGLLMQVIRNLLSNAFKYTKHGKVLLGCRRKGAMLRIQIWDTGIGISNSEFNAIFDEYHQLDNAARERGRGLGLGLSIANQLADLLGSPITVRSQPGKGSVFGFDIMLARPAAMPYPMLKANPVAIDTTQASIPHKGALLVIEDDPDVRDLVGSMLTSAGYRTVTASGGADGMELVLRKVFRPDLILADYNLPGEMNGLQIVESIRKITCSNMAAIILTGDTSTETIRSITQGKCIRLDKPVTIVDLIDTIEANLSPLSRPTSARMKALSVDSTSRTRPVVYVVDDDAYVRDEIRRVLETDGREVADYESCEAFLGEYRPGREACLLIDAYLPGMKGVELLERIDATGDTMPAIMITGTSDVKIAVQAMKAGAFDFIEKPITFDELRDSVVRAFEQSSSSQKRNAWREQAVQHISGLTPRQRQIMELVLAGRPSKVIASDLGISQRTVENHRALIMKKTGSKSLPALTRLVLAAQSGETDDALTPPSAR